MSSQAAMKKEMAGAQVRIDQNAFMQLLLGHTGLRLTCARESRGRPQGRGFLGAHNIGARAPSTQPLVFPVFSHNAIAFNSLPW